MPARDSLTGQTWQWVSFTSPVEQFDVDIPASYTLTFNEDGTVNIVANCNNAAGSYTDDKGALTIEIGPMTMAACPPDSRSDQFVQYLGFAARYFFQAGRLYIDLFADGGTMAFAPGDATEQPTVAAEPAPTTTPEGELPAESAAAFDMAALQGPYDSGWLWASYMPAEGAGFTIEDPVFYSLVFLEDGTIFVGSDCNFGTLSFTLDGNRLTIEPGEDEFTDCGEGSRSLQYRDFLLAAETVSMDGESMTIHLQDSGGVLTFIPFDPDADYRVDSWDEAAQKFLEQCQAPGAVLLVDSPAGRFLQAYGVASLEDGTPMQTGDRFEIGSNTKSFTAVLVLQLQEQDVWSLDDLLSQWLPDVAARLPYGGQITLRHLASNTSGVWDYADPLIGAAIENGALEQGYTPQELIDYVVKNGEASFAPGEAGEYSSTNFVLLGMALEAATGDSIGDLYQNRIFSPLGMKDSFLLEGVPAAGEIVDGYYTNMGETMNTTAWNASQGWAAGGIVSTAEDMARFAEALDAGTLFQDIQSTVELTNFGKPVLPFLAYGLGVGKFSDEPFAWGHGGQTAGFETLYAIFSLNQTYLVLLTNSASCVVQGFLSYVNVSPALLPDPLSMLGLNKPDFPLPEPEYNAKRARDLSPFADALAGLTTERRAELDALLADATVLDMQQAMASGQLTAEELVTYYVDRIQRYDIDQLNSVMELNPQAREIARQLDTERAAGTVRGAMHGIPVLLKDNIATGDGMHASAGAYALKDWQPDRDAFLVQQLRDAGAVILGKANLSEWANWMDAGMPNGFSVLGGQTRNPYGPFEPYGSSSGSAVAAAAYFAAATVGTETQGSIIMPAGINSVAAIKTSMGLVSRDYVVPLLEWQDVPGPMGRTVTDVAVLLTAMAGVDENDPVTQDAAALSGIDFTQYLEPEAREGLRVGIVVRTDDDIEQFLQDLGIADDKGEDLRQQMQAASDQQRQIGQQFSDLGFEVVEVSSSALPGRLDVVPALTYGFKDAINRFLAGLGDQVAVGSLEEIIALNAEDLANRAPYGQGHLEESQNTPLSEEEYLALKEKNQTSARDALSSLFADYDVDVLISDVGQAYAPAGFPAMTVPTGYDETGQPMGITMVAKYLGEPSLIAVGHALEQAAQARKAPDLEATMKQIEAIGSEAAGPGQSEFGATKLQYVADLEAAYGPPSQSAFGSAVFYESIGADHSLTNAALAKYKYFAGELWERYGEDAWMGPWKEVYTRAAAAKPDIVAELRGISDPDASISAPMILDVVQDADQARAALSAAFDDPAVTELRVFNLGDGEAMSGLLVAGRRADTADATFLVFLLD